MRKAQSLKRTEHLPMIRLTAEEKRQVVKAFNITYHKSLADFVREKLFATEITEYHRQKVTALLQLGDFRTKLNDIEQGITEIASIVITANNDKLQANDSQLLEEYLRELTKIYELLDKIVLP